jgi:arylsulfatase
MKKSLIYALPPALALFSCGGEPEPSRPNILMIMADDLGYSDLGCFGGEISTPNLDRLAENGIRFTHFYNTTRCCPTRASLITGLYPHEAGVGYMTHVNTGGGYLGYLNDSTVTIPEALAAAGYHTSMTGKWHSGAVRHSWPENRGFERFFGIHHWVDSYYKVLDDCEVFEDGVMVIPESDNPRLYAAEGKEWYTTDVFTTKAIEYLDEALDQGRPFFQYVAYNAPHWPLEAHDEVIERYLDRYHDGYEALRESRYQTMVDLGILDPAWNLPEQTTPDWDVQSDSARLDMVFRRAIYAAQVDIMDQNIGRLIRHLEDRGVLDNTVILFFSDNGCSAEPHDSDYGYQWGQNTRWNYEAWRTASERAGASQGKVWSVASNSPFRKHKRYTHEGGISTPLIVHWPEGITGPGRIDRKPSHVVDILPTCLELAGASYPERRDGVPVKPARGISLVDNLKGKNGSPHSFLFWEHEGHGALREGYRWKIVSDRAWDEGSWELYDMLADRTETTDLSAVFPEVRARMVARWEELAWETQVLPWPDYSDAPVNPVDK